MYMFTTVQRYVIHGTVTGVSGIALILLVYCIAATLHIVRIYENYDKEIYMKYIHSYKLHIYSMYTVYMYLMYIILLAWYYYYYIRC